MKTRDSGCPSNRCAWAMLATPALVAKSNVPSGMHAVSGLPSLSSSAESPSCFTKTRSVSVCFFPRKTSRNSCFSTRQISWRSPSQRCPFPSSSSCRISLLGSPCSRVKTKTPSPACTAPVPAAPGADTSARAGSTRAKPAGVPTHRTPFVSRWSRRTVSEGSPSLIRSARLRRPSDESCHSPLLCVPTHSP